MKNIKKEKEKESKNNSKHKIFKSLFAGLITSLIGSGISSTLITSYFRWQHEKELKELISELEQTESATIEPCINKPSFAEFKKDLNNQFKSLSVSLNNSVDGYVKSIYIDGNYVGIELVDNSKVEGELKCLELSGINLEDLTILDSDFLNDYHNKTYDNFESLLAEYNTHTKLILSVSQSDPISVHNTFKYSDNIKDIDSKISYNIFSIDLSDCKNLWLDNCFIFSNDLEMINSIQSLQKLYLTNCNISSTIESNGFSLNLPELQNLILDFISFNNLYTIDLTGCTNLQNISLGDTTQVENLDFLSPLDNLKEVSFGNLSYLDGIDILKSFKEEASAIRQPFQTDDERLAMRRVQ